MPRILVADDDPDMREWIAAVLGEVNYKVDVLSDGEQVLPLLEMGVIDLALIDHHLPKKSGLSVVREVRAAKNTTPLVMLTADVSQQLAVECFRAGASDFIAKPIDPDYLKIVVARALGMGAKSLKNSAFRALGYTHHKPDCRFHKNGKTCDCGLKELFEDIQKFV
ncbi:MAG: response regulator [Rhodospirillales bacterium]|nr:response regulator [Rhodospirillales bacterium]